MQDFQRCQQLELNKFPDFSLTVKQFSLTVQDDYSGHESTKIRMARKILKTKLPCINALAYH